MGVADIRVDFWQGEGFSIDELIDAAIRGGRIYADKQLVVTRTLQPYGLRFSGEIDITNSHAVPQSLSMAFVRSGDMHLDVRGLIFCDISGIRSFVDAAEAMDGGRLMLHGLPALLQKVMNVTGWSDIESLVLCDCEAVDR
jgi:anti-anti-sigma factor